MAKVQIRAIESRSGNKEGRPWAMEVCKCIVMLDDGKEDVGELVLPKGHPKVEIGKNYDVSVSLGVMQGRIVGRVVQLNASK